MKFNNGQEKEGLFEKGVYKLAGTEKEIRLAQI